MLFNIGIFNQSMGFTNQVDEALVKVLFRGSSHGYGPPCFSSHHLTTIKIIVVSPINCGILNV